MRHRFLSGWFGAALFSYFSLFVALGVLSAAGFLAAAAVQAEEAANADAPEGAEVAAEEDLSAPAPAEGEAPAAKGAPAESQPAESFLGWLYRSLTLKYSLVFLCLSFILVALLVMNILALLRNNVVPPALVEGFEACLNEKRYQEAYELAKKDDSFLGRVLAAGMARLSVGYDQAVQAMQETGEEENLSLEQRLGYMALIGQIGPMFGLLGTVDGMVKAFNVIARSNVTPRPSELAQGIGTALVTTIVGLLIAIPAIALYHILRNRMNRLVLEATLVTESLMRRFSGVGTPAKKA